MHTDFERCFRAVQAKDARFDGWFFIAVRTTGIYCRPSCPARSPLAENVEFFPTSAAAQAAAYRSCKRCRPDASPGSPEWAARADVTARAMRLIADGVVDNEGVPGLAQRLGYSVRQIERLLLAEVGAGPLALARAQRAQTARVLIETTDLGFADVAFAAGFRSIRQFNDTVRSVFDLTPTALREGSRRRPAQASMITDGPTGTIGTRSMDGAAAPGLLALRLPFRAPLEPIGLFGHLAGTAVGGCEEIRDGWFRRALRLPGGTGIVAVRPAVDHIACTVRLDDVRDLPVAINRVRRLLDLDADPAAIDDHLRRDAKLGSLVTTSPGRRLPRTVDEAEMALRVVLGQQVSTAAAATHAARLVRALGGRVTDPDGALTHTFPEPAAIGDAPDELFAMPVSRRETVRRLAAALATGDVQLDAGTDWDDARQRLDALPGIGPWTIELIALRALGDPDAFPATDMGVMKAMRALDLDATAPDGWRPWRSYAVQHLWSVLPHPTNLWPPAPRPTRRPAVHARRPTDRNEAP